MPITPVPVTVPLGDISYFGTLNFSAFANENGLIYAKSHINQYSRKFLTAFVNLPGQLFPYDRYGVSPSSYSEFQVTCTLTLLSPLVISADDYAAYKYLEQSISIIDQALMAENAGVSGQTGYLAFCKAGTESSVVAPARLLSVDYTLTAGETNTSMDIIMAFMILGVFTGG